MTSEIEQVAGSELADLLPKVDAGDRLSRFAGHRLWRTYDLTSLGALANLRRERVSGNSTFFRPAIHVNYTRRPEPACPLCSRSARVDGNPLAPVQLDAILEAMGREAVGELHLTGGDHSLFRVHDLCTIVRRVRSLCPKLRLRAFTWRELENAAAIDNLAPTQALAALEEAGLTSLAGGMLADLSPEHPHLDLDGVRQMERRVPWIEAAASLNFKCDVSWVFGDGDDPAVLVDSLIYIRELQDRWALFECFVPLLFDWPLEQVEIPMPTGYNQLRAIAVGRLLLDNIPRVRSSWCALTESVMQVAQWYGADDADSAILPGSSGFLDFSAKDFNLGRERLEELLRATGRDPVDTSSR